MADQSKYSIISISEDEDDVVIQAGDTSHRTVEDPVSDVSAEKRPFEPESGPSPASEQVDSKRAAREAELERLRKAEEDLKAKAPFPAMRAVIFAVAIVLLALAFVWLAFIR